MYEYHAWAVIDSDTEHDDNEPIEKYYRRLDELAAQARARLDPHGSAEGNWGLKNINAQYVVWCNGRPNHAGPETEQLFALFRHLAGVAPGSYGLIYVWDTEDESGCEGAFRVWRLARGELSEMKDTLLSPCVPTICDD